MEIVGILKMIDETKVVNASGFRKRDFVVTTDEQYPQHIIINLIQDKCDLMDNFKVGEQVKVHINIRGREWVNPEGQVKYFNDISAWKIEKIIAVNPNAVQPVAAPVYNAPVYNAPTYNAPTPTATPVSSPFEPISQTNTEAIDDLPF
jgi:hypothetical protein